jgi:hypothetical protein
MNIQKMTRFGRSFSIVRVPYSFKLLMQELMTMNVTMRVITADNIDQLESMSYSNTINKLTFEDENASVTDVVSRMVDKNKENSMVGYIASRTARKEELGKPQENTNAILLDNQKAQEKMLKDIEILGWRLEDRQLISGESAAPSSPSTGNESPETAMRRYKYTFASLILDENGSPTEIWDEAAGGGSGSGYGKFPTEHPVGWVAKDLIYPDGTQIPDEVMSNELARNQTPNNWISSYINIFQEFQKIQGKKRMVEEAQRQAEMGQQSGELGELEEITFTMPSSPEYTASSPMYTASSPVAGQQFASFVPAQMPAPGYMMPQVLQPVQVQVPIMQQQQQQQQQQAAQPAAAGSILSVSPPTSTSSGAESGEQGTGVKKIVTFNP